MKTKVLIIEDNYYKYFTTKQVLETQLHMKVDVLNVASSRELAETTQSMNPDMIVFRPNGGVAELLDKMKKRRTNRRNTEIIIAVAPELDDGVARRFQEFVASYPKRVANAA